jgi:hypothetical protein
MNVLCVCMYECMCFVFVLCMYVLRTSMYVCLYVFMLFIKHAPLQRNNTTCFIVHLCYIFVVGDAVTNTVNGFPSQLSLLHTLNKV